MKRKNPHYGRYTGLSKNQFYCMHCKTVFPYGHPGLEQPCSGNPLLLQLVPPVEKKSDSK